MEDFKANPHFRSNEEMDIEDLKSNAFMSVNF